MNRTAGLCIAAALASAAVLFPIPLRAQVPKSAAVSPPVAADDNATPEAKLAEVEAALAKIEADAAIEDAAKSLLRPKYEQAIEALKEAASNAAKAVEYREAIKSAPDRTAELRAELKKLPSREVAGKVTASNNPQALQQKLDSERAALAALNEQLATVTAELARLQGRSPEISARVPEAQRELSEIQNQLASPDLAEDVNSPARVADRLVLQARESKLRQELEMLKQEQLSQAVRQSLGQAQDELLTRQVENTTATVTALETLVRESVTREAQAAGSLAESAQSDVPLDDEAQALAAEVQRLAKELENVVQNKQMVSSAQVEITAKLNLLTRRYDGIRKQLDLGGAGGEMAQVLLDIRNFLRAPMRAPERASGLPTLDETRLAALQIDVKLEGQADVRSQFADRSAPTVQELVAGREDVLRRLQTQYQELIPEMAALDTDQRQYADKVTEVLADIRKQLFWIRISPPASADTLREFPSGLLWVAQGEHWLELGSALSDAMSRMPIRSTVVVFAAVVLLLMRRRIGAELERIGEKVRRISTDRYAFTGQALFWTALLAAPVPLLVGFVAWAFAQSSGQSDWMQGINRGLPDAVWIVSVVCLITACCHSAGLGVVHFRWRQTPLAQLRRLTHWLALVYLPLALLTCSTLYADESQYLDGVGRVCFMLAQAWMAIILWRMFRSSDGILATFVREEPTRLIARLRHLWLALVIACPLALITLTGVGYMVMAFRLSAALLMTLALVAGGVFLYGLALRWFVMKYRKLALVEALQRRRERQHAANTEEQHEESDELIPVDVDEAQLGLDAIGEQTRHLVGLLFGLGIIVAVVFFWSGMLPLVSVMENIVVPLTDLTLLRLTQAVLIVAVTWLAMKNLPGLLELAILRETTIDAGTRNAITTLCQYAVIATGLMLLFSVLKVDWTKFGWIAGGLSVGIGFGLQEVVANFVCGLILLFERPIRVGDVVTVEGELGTVTKISMRSTTITNFDRGEVVLPNKTLITSKLVNWTLSASTNRIVIPVGVAYGTDTEKARQILLDVAADHPNVLDDPGPVAIFDQFADSSLNLVLRAFLPDRGNREATITDLHTEIHKRFAAAGIEIPFPQQDLHLRSGWQGPRGDGSNGAENGKKEAKPERARQDN